MTGELDIEKWKKTIDNLGEAAFAAYFADERDDPSISWRSLSREIRAKWHLVAMALSEKLCPHDDKFVSSTGSVWCMKCGWQLSLRSSSEGSDEKKD